jgi:hypothetical protein
MIVFSEGKRRMQRGNLFHPLTTELRLFTPCFSLSSVQTARTAVRNVRPKLSEQVPSSSNIRFTTGNLELEYVELPSHPQNVEIT